MTHPTRPSIWPLSQLVIFDCDSTLSTIEGIDELARLAAVSHPDGESEEMAYRIATLTKRAMEGDIPLEAVYSQRLTLVRPTLAQVRHIAQHYRNTVIKDAQQIIHALQTLGVQVFIVSGGLIEPVRDFGIWLGVPANQIFAVNLDYDQLSGQWWRYWDQPGGENTRAAYLSVSSTQTSTGWLAGSHGKNRIISRLRKEHQGRALLVGDGLSDLEAAKEVDLFVGFGGAVYRQRIAEAAPVYIHSPWLSPILPIALGQSGNIPRFANLWADGLRRIHDGEVTFQQTGLYQIFLDALQRIR